MARIVLRWREKRKSHCLKAGVAGVMADHVNPGSKTLWSVAHANFLEGLSPSEYSALLSRAKTLRRDKRAHVFEAGDEATAVFVVVSGLIKLYQPTASGKQVTLSICLQGEIFGVAEFMQGELREISAEAVIPSELLAIPRIEFLNFLKKHPEAAMRTIGILSARLRTLGSALTDLATVSAETRLLRLLLRYRSYRAPSPGELPGNTPIHLPLTHQDIASLIGVARQTVTSMLTEFRKLGIVQTVGDRMHLIDGPELQKMLPD